MAGTETRLDGVSTERLLGGGSAVLAALAMLVGAGPVGAFAGVALIAVWTLGPPVYAFALGHLLVVGLGLASPALVIVEAGLFGLLAASLSLRTGAAFVVAVLGLLGVLWATRTGTDALWLVALVLAGSVALVAYGLHRYELVRFGLVEATP